MDLSKKLAAWEDFYNLDRPYGPYRANAIRGPQAPTCNLRSCFGWLITLQTTGKLEQLFVTNPVLNDYPLAKMHGVVIPSRDGKDLVSYLTTAHRGRPGRRRPPRAAGADGAAGPRRPRRPGTVPAIFHRPRRPEFSRGGVVSSANHDLVLLSGTAAIVGHESAFPDESAAQTTETLPNIEALLVNSTLTNSSEHSDAVRVYLRNPADFEKVARDMAGGLGRAGTQLAYLQGEISAGANCWWKLTDHSVAAAAANSRLGGCSAGPRSRS